MIIAAAAADVVDYSQFTPCAQWFTRESILLSAYENQQKARIWEARLTFRTGAHRDESATEAVNKLIDVLTPWLTAEDDIDSEDNKITDMIADWYRYFAGDQLEDMLAEGSDG